MVKIKMVCSVCGTHYYYDVVDAFIPRRCCNIQLSADDRLDAIDFSAELFERLGDFGEDLRTAIIADSQKITCGLCGARAYFYTTMPYGSAHDGYDICADCVRRYFDPVINQVVLETKDGE